jgi:enoyl-CoA hydratase/carnithine racemase
VGLHDHLPEFETITYREENAVAWVTLNRPDVYNCFNPQMMDELKLVWRSMRGNPGVRAAVLTGSGKAFCTGVDRSYVPDADPDGETHIGTRGDTPLHFDDPGDWLGPKSNDLWKPVIAAVNGMACGGAFYMLGECDMILAADDATFFDPHTTFGMTTVFEPIFMLSHLPLGEIMRISLLGSYERMSAQRAHQIGMVQELAPGAELLDRARWVAETIASQPARPVQATVRAIWMGRDLGRKDAIDLGKVLLELGNTPEDLAAGQAAFAGGQRVQWRLR